MARTDQLTQLTQLTQWAQRGHLGQWAHGGQRAHSAHRLPELQRHLPVLFAVAISLLMHVFVMAWIAHLPPQSRPAIHTDRQFQNHKNLPVFLPESPFTVRLGYAAPTAQTSPFVPNQTEPAQLSAPLPVPDPVHIPSTAPIPAPIPAPLPAPLPAPVPAPFPVPASALAHAPRPNAPDSAYIPLPQLSRKPVFLGYSHPPAVEVLSDASWALVQAHLFIDESGNLDRVVLEDNTLSEAAQKMMIDTLLSMRFSAAILNDLPVKARMDIELNLQDVSAGGPVR